MNQLRTNRLGTFLAALLLLVAALAPALCRTTCLHSGRSVVEVGHFDACCDNETPGGGPELRSTCCVHTEASAQVSDHTVGAPVKLVVSLPVVALLVPEPETILAAPVDESGTDRAPPRKAPERLSLQCSLLL
ncbi:MAG: hypothetical protein WAU70_07465 [Flavobacteriales bacterium]